MSIQGWKYYNHAMIPTTAPHEPVNLDALNSKSFWKENPKALLARWTTDWDCGYETNWWYCIRDGRINIEDLPRQARKDIRKGLKNCNVRMISYCEYVAQLYSCYEAAWRHYKNVGNPMTLAEFREFYDHNPELIFWAAFERESGKLIGYMTVDDNKDYAEICQAKFHPEYLKIQVSGAMYFTILSHYLEMDTIAYISSGSRSINHVTNTQDYKERTFGYRKAFCRLHIVYNPKIRWIIAILYPFRKVLEKLDSCRAVHLIHSVLCMEEIVRSY